jgi:hypothetical protein
VWFCYCLAYAERAESTCEYAMATTRYKCHTPKITFGMSSGQLFLCSALGQEGGRFDSENLGDPV